MGEALIVAMPLLGAAVPIIVTQLSKDDELRALGRSVVKYAIVLPVVLMVAVLGTMHYLI
jgi:hypothetical protein